MKWLAVSILIFAATSAFAHTEISVLGGYTSSSEIDMKAVGIQDLKIEDSFTWGLEATYFFTSHLGAEVLWVRQGSELTIENQTGIAELFELDINHLQGNFVYQFGAEQMLKPFVFAGVGAAFFSADDLESETKWSWDVGGGVKWFPTEWLGARVHARYNSIRLNDSSSDFCDPFGFCQDSLDQFEIMGGIVFQF
jgi:outer membrane protein W